MSIHYLAFLYLPETTFGMSEWWVNLLAVVVVGYASRSQCVGQLAWRLWQPARAALICAIVAAAVTVLAARCSDRKGAGSSHRWLLA
jgi:Mn2+/Fe2+ NRAMP family transporter